MRKFIRRIAALFWPNRCTFCEELMEHRDSELYICPACRETLVFYDEVTTCRICGRRVPEGEPLCDICRTHKHYFDKALSCLSYENSVRRSILLYKFGSHADHVRTFAALIANRLTPFCRSYSFDLATCPPLSEDGFRGRGFNQAAEIARRTAKVLGIPFREDVFRKVKETPKQSTLHYAERFKNVEDAFRLNVEKDIIRGKTVLLIDDVLTTGATADALSKLLKRVGAKTVIVATVAGTEPDRADKKMPINWNELEF